MRRTPAATLLALLLVTTACGGGSKPQAEPTPSPSPSDSATPTPSPTPTQSAAVTRQVRGKYGVTVTFLDWDRWGADPVVQAWDRFGELVGGSITDGRLYPDLKGVATGKAYDQSVQSFQQATTNGWRPPKVALARIAKVRRQGRNAALLVGCVWDPSQAYRDRDGKIVDQANLKQVWLRLEVPFTRIGGAWKATDQRLSGRCAFPPPRR